MNTPINQPGRALMPSTALDYVAPAADRAPPAPSVRKPVPIRQAETALCCLAEVAERLGIVLDVGALALLHARSERIDPTDLARLAQDRGLDAQAVALQREPLTGLSEHLPVIAVLENGNMVVVIGVDSVDSAQWITLKDPIVPGFAALRLEGHRFLKVWGGEAVLVSVRPPGAEDHTDFGLGWFTREMVRFRGVFAGVLLASFMTNLVALVVPFFFMIVLDKVITHNAVTTLTTIGIGVLGLVVFDAVLDYLRGHLLADAVRGLDRSMMLRAFNDVLSLPMAFFDERPRGVLGHQLQQTEKIRQFMTGRLFSLGVDLLFVVLFALLLFTMSPTMGWLVMGAALCLLTVSMVTAPFYRTRVKRAFAAGSRRDATMVETVNGIASLKALGLEPFEERQWARTVEIDGALRQQLQRLSAFNRAISGLIDRGMWVAVIWVGSYLAMDGSLSIGALVAINIIARRVSSPLGQLASVIHEYQEMLVSLRALGEVMERPAEQTIVAGASLAPQLTGRFEFDDATFYYAGSKTAAISGVSLAVPAGSFVALVGRSGSGKSTLLRLLLGLYRLSSGAVRLDGYDLRELNLGHVRRSIGTVLQDSCLFRGTIRGNIQMARESAMLGDVIRAARNAGADEFIRRLPLGYDTVVEENARNLSSGQCQRVALARALVRESSALLLDEITSALDAESVNAIRRSLQRLRGSCTIILATHDLDMARDADLIGVLDGGRLVGQGRHDDLITDCAAYRTLCEEQRARHGR